jgi:hypothetical protein
MRLEPIGEHPGEAGEVRDLARREHIPDRLERLLAGRPKPVEPLPASRGQAIVALATIAR